MLDLHLGWCGDLDGTRMAGYFQEMPSHTVRAILLDGELVIEERVEE